MAAPHTDTMRWAKPQVARSNQGSLECERDLDVRQTQKLPSKSGIRSKGEIREKSERQRTEKLETQGPRGVNTIIRESTAFQRSPPAFGKRNPQLEDDTLARPLPARPAHSGKRQRKNLVSHCGWGPRAIMTQTGPCLCLHLGSRTRGQRATRIGTALGGPKCLRRGSRPKEPSRSKHS